MKFSVQILQKRFQYKLSRVFATHDHSLLRSRHLDRHATDGEKHCVTPQLTVAKEANMTGACFKMPFSAIRLGLLQCQQFVFFLAWMLPLGYFFYLYKQVVQEFLWYNFVHCVPWQRDRQGGRLWNTWPHGPISISAFYSRVNLDLVSSLTLSWHCSFIAFKLLFIRSAFLESKNIGYWRSLVKYYKLFEVVTSGLILLFKYFEPITLQLQKSKTKDQNMINPKLIPIYNKSEFKKDCVTILVTYIRLEIPHRVCTIDDIQFPWGDLSLLISIAGQHVEVTRRIRTIRRFTFNHGNTAWKKKTKKICYISANYLDITHGCLCDFHFFLSHLSHPRSLNVRRGSFISTLI